MDYYDPLMALIGNDISISVTAKKGQGFGEAS